MNPTKPTNPTLRDFLHDLRQADPLFCIGAAIVAAIFISRWLFTP